MKSASCAETQEIEVTSESVATESARSIPAIASAVKPSQEHVLIVGCSGPLQIPVSHQADYFRAHGFVAIIGATVWLLLFLTGLLV
jgi:hypothetical protein